MNELAVNMAKSTRQTQRLFLKHYGLTPKMILSVIRFQRSLEILLDIGGSNRKPADIDCLGYYDQPHLIKEIKKNIGITPVELLKNYQKD